MMMNIQNFLSIVPFFRNQEADRSEATRTDRDSVVSSAASQSVATRSSTSNGRPLNFAHLPREVQERVAGFLSIKGLKAARLANAAVCCAANAHVALKVNNGDSLASALEAYRAANAIVKPAVNDTNEILPGPAAWKEGGITKITLGNGDKPRADAATFTDEHLALLTDLPIDTADLSYCNITDEGLCFLPRRVQAADLSWCTKIKDLGGLPATLRTLKISGCTRVSDKGAVNMPRDLETLDASGCLQFTDDTLRKIPRKLKTLNLSVCFLITDEGTAHIPHTVTWLDVSGCDGVSRAAIDALRARLASGSVIIHDVPSIDRSEISPREDGLITFNAWTAD